MNRFRSHRGSRGSNDDDPTRMLQFWRDQQREERLADTQELPQFLDGEPLPARRPPTERRRRVPLVVVAGLATLGVVGAVAVATTAGRPDAGGVTSTAPSDTATSTPSATSPTTTGSDSPSDTGASAAPSDAAGPAGPHANRPGPAGPGAGGPRGRGAGADGPGAGGPGAAGHGPAAGPPAGPGG